MPADLQTIEALAVVPLDQVQIIPDSVPVSLQIRGGPFVALDAVLINNIASPSFIQVNDREIWAQVPSGMEGSTVSVAVLSQNLLNADHVQLRFRLGKQTRKISGLARLVQMFVRILLMSPGTNLLNPALGGGLLRALRSSYNPNQLQGLQTEVYLAVQRASEQLMTLQAREVRTPRDERILSAKVLGCGVAQATGQLALDLELLSQTGKRFLVSAAL